MLGENDSNVWFKQITVWFKICIAHPIPQLWLLYPYYTFILPVSWVTRLAVGAGLGLEGDTGVRAVVPSDLLRGGIVELHVEPLLGHRNTNDGGHSCGNSVWVPVYTFMENHATVGFAFSHYLHGVSNNRRLGGGGWFLQTAPGGALCLGNPWYRGDTDSK